MAWTNWYQPRQITYLNTDEIGYTDGDSVLDTASRLVTVEPVYGVGTSASTTAVNQYGANSLLLSDFGIAESGTVQGIAVETDIVRLNRVRDNRVQFYWAGQLIGENRASTSYDQRQQYGGEDDTWGISVAFDHTSPEFGLVLDLAPHDRFPSSTRPIVRRVSVRLFLV